MSRTLADLAAYKRAWRARSKEKYAGHERKRLQSKNAWRRRRTLAGKVVAFKSFHEFFDFYDPVSVVQGRHLTDPTFVVVEPSGRRRKESLTDPLPIF